MTAIVADVDNNGYLDLDVVLLASPCRMVIFRESTRNENEPNSAVYKRVIKQMGLLLEELLPDYMLDEVLGSALDQDGPYVVTSDP